jgi:methylthioribulose-1-phosphate dehydratase
MASTEEQAVAVTNNNDHLVQSEDPEHPANLIPELCRKFYNWGWVTGTGGGVSLSFAQVRRSAKCHIR